VQKTTVRRSADAALSYRRNPCGHFLDTYSTVDSPGFAWHCTEMALESCMRGCKFACQQFYRCELNTKQFRAGHSHKHASVMPISLWGAKKFKEAGIRLCLKYITAHNSWCRASKSGTLTNHEVRKDNQTQMGVCLRVTLVS